MSTNSFILSSAGLKNIVIESQENEFTFCFGKREVKTHKTFAEFISPKVSHLHHCDLTIDSIQLYDSSINFDEIITEDTINELQQLSQGYSINITKENLYSLRVISVMIDNDELFDKLNQNFPQDLEKASIDDILNELKLYLQISRTFDESKYDIMIDYLASHFFTISFEKLKSLPTRVIYEIIINEHFKHEDESEDKLIDIINDLFANESEQQPGLIEFYEEIDFLKLSENKLRQIIEHLDFTQMTRTLWHKLCECFFFNRESVTKDSPSNAKCIAFEFDGNENHRFDGIIKHLTQEFGGNLHQKGIVNATTSSRNAGYCAIELESDKICQTDSKPNQWLMYDFKDRRIRPTHYSIRTRNDNCDLGNPMNWCIEVSNTGNTKDWRVIDSREGVRNLMKANQSGTFEVSTELQPDESYRYIRMRQTGTSTGGIHFLTLTALEFFGKLI